MGIVEFRTIVGDKEKNLETALRVVDQAAQNSVDILVLPELWSSGYLAGVKFAELAEKIPGPTTNAMCKKVSAHHIFLVGGSIPEVSGGRLYNTLFASNRQGKIICKHRKAHLFGPYEKKYFTPGNKCSSIETEFGRLGFGICYDGDFQEYSRVLALQGSKIYFNTAATASPDEDDWRLFYPCFARQNGIYVVCTNLVGFEPGEYAGDFRPEGMHFFGESKIIDPYGKVIIQSDPNRQETSLYFADIDPSLVETIRAQGSLTLQNRRPELYKMLLSHKPLRTSRSK